MTSIITGDIINSRKAPSEKWLHSLKSELNKIGATPKDWEIYRGDSFQVEIKDPKQALTHAIQLKAVIKQYKGLDVRMCIGIGGKSYSAENITESNGEAFIHSGQGFEELKKNKQTLSIVSPNSDFNQEMNLLIRLSLIAMDNWTPAVAEFVTLSSGLLQEQIAKILDISQASVSERNQRSYLSEIRALEKSYRKKISAYKLGTS